MKPAPDNDRSRDDFSSIRHPALSFCLSMISGQTLRVCREGKPVSTFPDHALAAAADALDLAVQRRSLAVDRIVRITQVFLRRHVTRARLPVADRGFARRLGLTCSAR